MEEKNWNERFRKEFIRLGGPAEVVENILCNLEDDPEDAPLKECSPEAVAKKMYDLQEEE